MGLELGNCHGAAPVKNNMAGLGRRRASSVRGVGCGDGDGFAAASPGRDALAGGRLKGGGGPAGLSQGR
jgi:hypothetical protein